MHSPACLYHKCLNTDISSEQYYIYHSQRLFGIACLKCTPILKVAPTRIIFFLEFPLRSYNNYKSWSSDHHSGHISVIFTSVFYPSNGKQANT